MTQISNACFPMSNLVSNPSFSVLTAIVLGVAMYLVCLALREQRLRVRKIRARSPRRTQA